MSSLAPSSDQDQPTQSESGQPTQWYEINPTQLNTGKISVLYSPLNWTDTEGDITKDRATRIFPDFDSAYEYLGGEYSEAEFKEAIADNRALVTNVLPPVSGSGTHSISRGADPAKRVYFRTMDTEPGPCTYLKPCAPAEQVKDYPDLYSFSSLHVAQPYLGNLRRYQDGRPGRFRLRIEVPGGTEYQATVVASLCADTCTDAQVNPLQRKQTRTVTKSLWDRQQSPS